MDARITACKVIFDLNTEERRRGRALDDFKKLANFCGRISMTTVVVLFTFKFLFSTAARFLKY